MMPPPSLRGVREFELPGPGRLVQGGADAVRCFYKEPGTIIVNCARRSGTASVEMRGEVDIYWLPMTEANMEHACKCYMNEYGQTLLAAWQKRDQPLFVRTSCIAWNMQMWKDALQQGKTVAVHCSLTESLKSRMLHVAKQLVSTTLSSEAKKAFTDPWSLPSSCTCGRWGNARKRQVRVTRFALVTLVG